MIGIYEIASYIPNNFKSNLDKASKFEVNEDFILNKIGVRQVSQLLKDEETSDMCVKAFLKLKEKVEMNLDEIDCVIVSTQNPDYNGLPHTSAILHSKLGLKKECAAFDISLGCSGYVYGLSIIKSFMEANNFNKGLFFTADPYSKIVDQNDKNTALLFGDAATVSLLTSNEKEIWYPRKFLFGTDGNSYMALNTINNNLEMNGRAVFNFCATVIPRQVKQLVENLDIDMYFFHQGSKYIIDTLKKRMNLPSEKVPMNLENQGNTISSSIPLLFEQHIHRQDMSRVVMSGFGVGLSSATCYLEKTKEES